MNVTVERAALLAALSRAAAIVETRQTIPILANVLIRAGTEPDGGGRVTIIATDMDCEVTVAINAEVRAAGAVTVPARTFKEIVQRLPEGAQVEIDQGNRDSTATVRAGRSRFALGTLPVADFPAMAPPETNTRIQLTGPQVRDLLSRTAPVMSREDQRYYLNGVYFYRREAKGQPAMLRAVATDGHRLAHVDVPAPDGAEAMPGVILPAKAVKEILSLADKAGGPVDLHIGPTKVAVEVDGVRFVSKVIDGTYPDYERVIPTGQDRTMIVDGKQLKAAVQRVVTVTEDKSRAVRFEIDKGSLHLVASSSEVGSAEDEIEVSFDGEPITIGFNSRYIGDMVTLLGDGPVRLRMIDPMSPVLIDDPDDRSALFLVMPMRA